MRIPPSLHKTLWWDSRADEASGQRAACQRESENSTGRPGEAAVHICGRERITDQVMILWSELNLILSSVSGHQEQVVVYWLKPTSSAVRSD